jgi:hypothetical protein
LPLFRVEYKEASLLDFKGTQSKEYISGALEFQNTESVCSIIRARPAGRRVNYTCSFAADDYPGADLSVVGVSHSVEHVLCDRVLTLDFSRLTSAEIEIKLSLTLQLSGPRSASMHAEVELGPPTHMSSARITALRV